MSYGYTPPEEREEEETDFVRLSRALADVDVGPQEGDGAEAPPAELEAHAPAPKAAPKSVDALKRAQAAANHASKRAQLGRAGSDFIAAFGGYKADDSFWDSAEKQGAQGVVDVEKLRGVERQEGLDSDNKRLTEARLAALSTPKAGAAANPAQATLMEARAKEIEAKLAAGAQEEEEDDASLEADRKTLGAALKMDLSGVSRRGMDALMKYTGQSAQLKDRVAARSTSAAARQESAAAKHGAAAKKGAEKDASLFLRGYRLRPDARPRATEAEHIRKAQASTDTIDASVKELEGIYRKYGTSVLPGDVRARAEALTTDLQLSMKGPEQYALGVLAGPDMGLLEKTIPNPTGVNATLLDFFSGDQNVLARYASLRSQAKRRFEDKARSLGYERGEAEREAPGANLAAPAGGKGHGKVVKETKTIRQYEDGYLEEKT